MAKNTHSAVQLARRKANKKEKAKNSSKYKAALEIVNNCSTVFLSTTDDTQPTSPPRSKIGAWFSVD